MGYCNFNRSEQGNSPRHWADRIDDMFYGHSGTHLDGVGSEICSSFHLVINFAAYARALNDRRMAGIRATNQPGAVHRRRSGACIAGWGGAIWLQRINESRRVDHDRPPAKLISLVEVGQLRFADFYGVSRSIQPDHRNFHLADSD